MAERIVFWERMETLFKDAEKGLDAEECCEFFEDVIEDAHTHLASAQERNDHEYE